MKTNIHQINLPFKYSRESAAGRIGALRFSMGWIRIKHILGALFGGILLLAVSPAFAEGPYLSDQDVLKAWGVSQMEGKPISQASTLEGTQGPQMLTDEELDKINAGGVAGLNMAGASLNYTLAFRSEIDEPGKPMMPPTQKPMPTTR